jgi:hypothetical protein
MMERSLFISADLSFARNNLINLSTVIFLVISAAPSLIKRILVAIPGANGRVECGVLAVGCRHNAYYLVPFAV